LHAMVFPPVKSKKVNAGLGRGKGGCSEGSALVRQGEAVEGGGGLSKWNSLWGAAKTLFAGKEEGPNVCECRETEHLGKNLGGDWKRGGCRRLAKKKGWWGHKGKERGQKGLANAQLKKEQGLWHP